MRRFEKWLTGIAPDDPVDRVARHALKARLAAVSYFLTNAMAKGEKEEGVHQLRIWTRRAAAALRLFDAALPKSRTKWMKKALRKIRRSAGAVRDCDVYLDRLQAADPRPPKSIWKGLRKERRAARKTFKARRRQLRGDDRFDKRAEELLAGVAWPKRHSSREAPPFGFWCRYQIAPLSRAFLTSGSDDLHDDQKLHQFRIAAKRLRYALELAGPAIPPRMQRRLYEDLSDLQDRLGDVCDHLAAAERLRDWLAKSKNSRDRRELNELLRDEQRALLASRRGFLRWWSRARQKEFRKKWSAATGEGSPSE